MDMPAHLPPETPDGPERLAESTLVYHAVQAHPNNLVDPWWMNEGLTRGYPELLYKQWPVDFEDVEPAVLDRRFPVGVELMRRATFLNRRSIECVVASEGAMA